MTSFQGEGDQDLYTSRGTSLKRDREEDGRGSISFSFSLFFYECLSRFRTMGESRTELLAWLNDLLQLNYTKVEQAGTGKLVSHPL